MSDPEGSSSSFLQIEGELAEQDRELLLSVLGRLGYKGSALNEEQAKELFIDAPEKDSTPFRFAEITKPDDILVREHFEDLANQQGVQTMNYVRAFHLLVNGSNTRRLYIFDQSSGGRPMFLPVGVPVPAKGLEIVKREGVDHLGEYANKSKLSDKSALILADYGIVAGSIVQARAQIREQIKSARFKNCGEKARQAIDTVITTLSEQLGQPETPSTDTETPQSFHTLRFIGQPEAGTKKHDQWPTIEINTEPLELIQTKGPGYARDLARNIMVMNNLVTDDSPVFTEYAGIAESASILGVTKQRVDQLAKKGVMPPAIEHLASGQVWATEDVIVVALLRNTKPNHPPMTWEEIVQITNSELTDN